MANTTNFNWETPDDTDLVKDGAAAIRTLGSAIDTSLVDLKGGTTGQVLSKATNTDMDFTWVAQDDSNAIQNAIIDAKGDLIVGTAADTPARLAVGTNGQVLKANSATASGLEWATDASGMTNPMTTTGDTIYSSSGSTPARLGIGTTGQVLTVASGLPSWATPAASGGLTLLSTTALSGASVTVSSISQDYKNLVLLVTGLYTVSVDSGTYFRFNGDTGSNYSFWGIRTINTTVTGSGFIQSKYYANDRTITANTSGKTATCVVKVYRYTDTTANKSMDSNGFSYETGGNGSYVTRRGYYMGTSAIDSVTCYGDYDFSGGTLYIYGEK